MYKWKPILERHHLKEHKKGESSPVLIPELMKPSPLLIHSILSSSHSKHFPDPLYPVSQSINFFTGIVKSETCTDCPENT